jgi:hypothetical protein
VRLLLLLRSQPSTTRHRETNPEWCRSQRALAARRSTPPASPRHRRAEQVQVQERVQVQVQVQARVQTTPATAHLSQRRRQQRRRC